ncbi:MAG: type IV secretory system conjugative DNA transfer family protein [Lachnospiraceae bacterium]
MNDKKTIRNNFIQPIKDKHRTMRLNHFLSNKYTLIGIVTIVDVGIFFLSNYCIHFIKDIPFILKNLTSVNEYVGLRYALPDTEILTWANILLFTLIVAIIDLIIIYKMKTAYSEDWFNVGQKGVERFVETAEIIEEYKEIEELETPYEGMPGILISRIGNKLYIDNSVVHNLFLGITRSGKGELFVKTSIEIYTRAQWQPSLLVNDPKLEHYKVFKKKLEERGYLVYLLNCSNPALSMGFNPLSCSISFYRKKDYDTAEMAINSFAFSYFNVEKASGDMRYFTSAASDLCAAMILASIQDAFRADEEENQKRYREWKKMDIEDRVAHPFEYLRHNEKTINFYSMIINFGNLVTMPINDTGTRTMLDTYFENRPGYDRARLKYLSVEVAPGKTKSGVFSEMLREMSVFTLHNVAQMTAESSLDFMDLGFGKKPIAVFMATPSYDKSLNRIPTIFIRQMYYVLGKACDDRKGKCDRLVKCILDEAGNMPAIELLDTMTTMGLGQNVSIDFYLQNYEQLTDVYGEQTAETIKGNCGNHIYIQTKSKKTAEEFSQFLGNKSIIDVQRAGGKLSMDKYFTESIQQELLLDANKLLGLEEGECVIHRTMKRRDNQGRKIKPRPIFNSIENGRYLNYSYEFFGSEYAHPNSIDFLEICTESRAGIEPRDRIWDVDKSFRMQTQQHIKLTLLKNLNFDQIDKILKKTLGMQYQITHGITKDTSVANFIDFVNQNETMIEIEKETILTML